MQGYRVGTMSKATLPSEFVCKGCGETVVRVPKQGDLRREYCSQYCKQKAWNKEANGKCLGCGGKPESAWSTMCVACRRARAAANSFTLIPLSTCAMCGKPGRHGKQTCSTRCATRARAKAMTGKKLAPYVRAKRAFPCTDCGAIIRSTRASMCKKCARRRAGRNHCERAKRAGVTRDYGISNTKVFQRDMWTCQMCGCATPKDLQGTNEPNAPELDHIVPISRGGPHTWDNVQCSCRKCNGYKGNDMGRAVDLQVTRILGTTAAPDGGDLFIASPADERFFNAMRVWCEANGVPPPPHPVGT